MRRLLEPQKEHTNLSSYGVNLRPLFKKLAHKVSMGNGKKKPTSNYSHFIGPSTVHISIIYKSASQDWFLVTLLLPLLL